MQNRMSNTNNQFSLARVALKPAQCLGLLALISALVIEPPVVRGQTLAQALNTTNLTWTTSGAYGGWYSETTTTHDGVSAADSGSVHSSGTSTLQTTVTGPGTLTFWWTNPSFDNRLSFTVGGVTLTYIILYTTWQQQTFYLASGSQTLQWVYSVSTSPGDSYHGYVDQVSYTPGATAPRITAQPTGQSQVPGFNATFTVGTGGTPPLYYQWKFNGTNISGATTSTYTVTNVQAGNLGNYSVVVTNGVDSIVSSNAALEFGQITGWGSAAYGDIAIATGATNVLAIAAGLYCNLLLNVDGTLSGWGDNRRGQMTVPANLTNAIAIAAYYQSLALNPHGTVAAWGMSGFGETNVPAGLSNVVAIAAGRFSHSLALKSDGTVAGWGGVLGETNVPAGLTNVVAIAGGQGYDLALKADGTLATWGTGSPGVPTGLTNVVAIAAGSGHDLALLVDGTVVAWGQNGYGQASVPTALTNVVAIAAGDLHSLALLANGTVAAWGYNANGQTNVPTGLTNVVAISAGANHNLAQVGLGPPVLRDPVTNPTLSGSGFSLVVPSQSGRVYALEYKNSLSDASWVSLPLAAGTGTNLVLADFTATNAQRFYHVRRW
jgi:Regulator of chromosome condensation (RCC1) repeat/Immunoglobulin domain